MKLTVCILTTILVGAVNASFDCRRDTSGSCFNGATCDTGSGDCSGCPVASHEGYDCSVPLADKNHADCTSTNPCQNGGTCHRAATGAVTFTCLCTEDYAGTTCTEKRYEVDCATADQMTMSVIPQAGSSFTGSIYIEGRDGVSDCLFTLTSGKYTLTLTNTHTNCGDAADVASGGKSRQAIVIFEGSEIVTIQDEIVTFTCTPSGTQVGTVSAVTVTNVIANLINENTDNGPTDEDIDFTVTLSDDSAITGYQDLGTVLLAKAALTSAGGAKYTALRLQTCTAASHVDAATGGVDYQTKDFINSFCISPDLANSFVGDITRVSTEVSYQFRLFKFTSTSELFISCTVQACVVAADCNAETCTLPLTGSGLGRKKRDAGYTVHRNLTQRITIRDPFAGNAVAAAKEEAKACYQTWQMTATVVALAVALLLVLLLCLFLITKAILNRRSTKTYREDVSVTNSSDHLPHLPTIITNKA